MISTNLIDEPVSVKDYTVLPTDRLPKAVLGFRIKNKFDESRLKIKQRYNPKYMLHFKTDNQLEPTFIYGISINLKREYDDLLKCLNSGEALNDTVDQDRRIYRYQNLLLQYKLSCGTCYSYLSDGIYPIDMYHLGTICRRDFSREIDGGFRCMIEKTEQPWYLNIANFSIFILGYSSGYNTGYQVHI